MPEALDIEADEFLRLLTDALRAGPGSPEWRQAVSQLRNKKGGARDEYQLLCQAREHLESGKSYRSVIAGPGFTKKVLAGIDEEEQTAGPEAKVQAPPTANLVALLSAIVLIGVIGVIAYFLLPAGGDPNRAALDDLANIYFVTTGPTTSFGNASAGGEMPAGWRAIGQLSLDLSHDLRPASATQPLAAGGYLGGGAVMNTPLSPTEPVAVEFTLSAPQGSADVSTQIFVTDDPTFSDDRASSPHEFVWLLQGTQSMVVLPTGRITMIPAKVPPTPDPFAVRVVMNRDLAMIEIAGQRVFSGAHLLSPDKPRYVGVRFVRTAPKPTPVAFTSVKIQKPQTTR